MKKYFFCIILILPLLMAGGCKFYRQDIMFKVDGNVDPIVAEEMVKEAETNYRIKKNDWLALKVYTNKGELIIDPNQELTRQIGGGGMGMGMGAMMGGSMQGAGGTSNMMQYLVTSDGTVNLPMVGRLKLDSLTYRQADSLLASKYGFYYEEPFVFIRTANRRVFVFNSNGNAGGGGRVVGMSNESMSLVEVLADVGGLNAYSDARNIRIIRNINTAKPIVKVINMQYISTMKKHDLIIYPNDIIYVEPGRRPFLDFLRDYGSIISLPVSVVSIILVFTRLR